MSYYTFLIENDDIQFNSDGTIKMTQDSAEGLGQSYKILIETVYGSDFRDIEYGFKLTEFYNIDFSDKEDQLRLLIEEVLLSHTQTEKVLEIKINGDSRTRKYTVECTVQTKLGEIVNFTANI